MNPMFPRLGLAALALLSGCATAVDVRSVSSVGSAATYELRGKTMFELDAQALKLCPNGHQVLNAWQRQQGTGGDSPGMLRKAWLQASQITGTLPEDEAQETVQCSS